MRDYKADYLEQYRLLNDIGYHPWEIYNSEDVNKALRDCVRFYKGICGNDQQILKATRYIEKYAAINNDIPDTYIAETKCINAELSLLDDYYDEVGDQLDKKPDDEILMNRCMTIAAMLLIVDTIICGGLDPSEADPGLQSQPRRIDQKRYGSSFMPLFTHDVLKSDISPEFLQKYPLFTGMVNVARLYPIRIMDCMCDCGDGYAAVKLWKKDGDNYRPVIIKVDKELVYKKYLSENKGLCLWPGFMWEAYLQSGIKLAEERCGAFVECVMGPDFAYANYDAALKDAGGLEGGNIDLYSVIKQWVRDGFAISVYSNGEIKSMPKGTYNLVGAFRLYDEQQECYIRLSNPMIKDTSESKHESLLDVKLSAFLNGVPGLDFNGSDELAQYQHNERLHYDIIDEDEIERHRWQTVSGEMAENYLKCAFDIYGTMFALGQKIPEKSMEYQRLVFCVKDLAATSAFARGCDVRIISNNVDILKKISDMLRESIRGNTKGYYAAMLDVCDCVDIMYERMYARDESRDRLLDVFRKKFAERFARALVVDNGMKPDPDLIDNKSDALLNEDVFNKIVEKMTIVNMLHPSDKQLSEMLKKYYLS